MIENQTNLLKHYLNALSKSVQEKNLEKVKIYLSVIHVLSPTIYSKLKSSIKNA
jgi:hypothetical protein